MENELLHYALSHGIVYGLRPSSTIDGPKRAYAVHAPFTLSPFSYPRTSFEKAQALATVFNLLVHKIACSPEWIISTLSHTGESDDFTGRLLQILKTVRSEGTKQKCMLGVFRSDYMLHSVEGDDRDLLQVEINTIASSFGALSTNICTMHRSFYPTDDVPANSAIAGICDGIFAAHCKFQAQTSNLGNTVVMITQNNERNFADQRLLEYYLREKHGLNCLRLTLKDVHERGVLNEHSGVLSVGEAVVSVVYFRAGYTPDDYPSEVEWSSRLLIERSLAIKCPNIATHLAGCKKIQQVLAMGQELEKFASPEHCILLRQVFAGLYSLDTLEYVSEEERLRFHEIKQRAIANPRQFVIKPQREGGGNNLYGAAVAEALQTMSDEDLAAYILMERIFPPKQNAQLVRDGAVTEEECLCELGIFGVILSDDSSSEVDINQYCGYLLRVKSSVCDEGGVAAGYAVLSAPRLI